MLYLIPPSIHRAALRIAHELRKLWWRWRKPELVGVNVLVRDGAGHVLLVRHSYEQERWTLPGGGLHRGELPAAAAEREMAEELGCQAEGLTPVGVNDRSLYGARCVTHVFLCDLALQPSPDGREVIEARYFRCDELPPRRTAMVDACLAML